MVEPVVKPVSIDVYCPGCARVSFRAIDGTKIEGGIEVKCHRCGTVTFYHNGFVFTPRQKEKVRLPSEK